MKLFKLVVIASVIQLIMVMPVFAHELGSPVHIHPEGGAMVIGFFGVLLVALIWFVGRSTNS